MRNRDSKIKVRMGHTYRTGDLVTSGRGMQFLLFFVQHLQPTATSFLLSQRLDKKDFILIETYVSEKAFSGGVLTAHVVPGLL